MRDHAPDTPSVESLGVSRDGVELAGSLWRPAGRPLAVVLMHPGSGPSDRHNDIFFPPIRSALLAAGFAVASFDKRGAGDSGGVWWTTTIEEQADDLVAADAVVRDRLPDVPVAWFGHSQGGWVVVEAAGRAVGGRSPMAVVVNSGPGVGPAAQERHALAVASGPPADEALLTYDRLVDLARRRAPLTEARALVDGTPAIGGLAGWTADEQAWTSVCAVIPYEPEPAQRRLTAPTLVVFGELDPIVPVEVSIDAFRERVDGELLTVSVIPGGDHRMGDGDRLVSPYPDVVVRYLTDVATRDMATGRPSASSSTDDGSGT